MENYESSIKTLQATLTCIAIVLGGWWFVARDAWSHRIDISTVRHAVLCLEGDTLLLTVQFQLKNVGERAVQIKFETHEALNMGALVETQKYNFRYAEPASLGRLDPRVFEVSGRSTAANSRFVFSVRPNSTETFWRDFVIPNDLKAIRLNSLFTTNDQELLRTANVYRLNRGCQRHE